MRWIEVLSLLATTPCASSHCTRRGNNLIFSSQQNICTGGAARTPDTRFWRPMLYQLSYTRVRELTRLKSDQFYWYYSRISVICPAPTVLPPSRIAKRSPMFNATGWIRVTVMVMLSPGITISTPAGSSISPVTSSVRR